jgi:S4 domain protein YaaA
MKIEISTKYITLGQFLKYAGFIGSGALAKQYLLDNQIFVNGELETRRGRKLYPDYIVRIDNSEYQIGKSI